MVLLGLEHDIDVVGEGANGEEAVAAVRRLKPDVLLLDLTMPVMTGMEAIPHVREASPDTRIVVLTMYRDVDYMRAAFEAGAVGYVVKSTADEEVVGAVRAAFQGATYQDASVDPDAGEAEGREGDDPPGTDDSRGITRRDRVLLRGFGFAC
jgi:DNA-binding NarL/FixJ family response regulator